MRASNHLSMYSGRRVFVSLVMVIMMACAAFGAGRPQLSEKYKKWLQQDVAYIITNLEKKAFLDLPTDPDRDRFIEHFWEIRNPNPGSPTNPYKDEHYSRLEYAIDHFSTNRTGDGWKTAMGRVYITLGAPQQKARYVVQGGVRGMEIWFYSNSHPALPPFFSVIFYEKDPGDSFRLYSPFMDGPEKLVTGIQAEQGKVAAVQQIDRLLGREVALTTLSLIPGEPVNMNDPQPSLQSDLMLGTIRDLANNPLSLDELKTRRALNEDVTHRIVLPNDVLNVMCVPLRDGAGNVRLHYALRLTQPEDFAVAQADDRYYYSLEALVKVLGPDGKEIFSRERKIKKFISKGDLDLMKSRPLAYEGWLPLAPGKYKLDFLFTNVLTKTAFSAQREIAVPPVAAGEFFVTDPVPFSQAATVDPSQAEALPFTVGGVRFRPYVGQEVSLVPGEDLKFFYQVWRPPAKGQSVSAAYPVEYAFGRLSASGTAQVVHDELPPDQFDPYGSVVSGKKIPTSDMGTGSYRMTVSLTDPNTHQKRFSAMRFNIVTDTPSLSDNWWIDDDGLAEYVAGGQADFDRGLTYLVGGDAATAVRHFQEALSRNPGHERARGKLIDYYFQRREFAKVIDLFSQTSMTAETGDSTILDVADSFDKTGNPKRAAGVLESALSIKPPSGALYLALASYYDHLGDGNRAESFRQKGNSLIAEPANRPVGE